LDFEGERGERRKKRCREGGGMRGRGGVFSTLFAGVIIKRYPRMMSIPAWLINIQPRELDRGCAKRHGTADTQPTA
jgi:hypothetical protein